MDKDTVLKECRRHWACPVSCMWLPPSMSVIHNVIETSCPFLIYVGRYACKVQIGEPELFDQTMRAVHDMPQGRDGLSNMEGR